MSIIAIIGNKGGVGKTTLAINLATLLSEQAATCLLDADPQGSILHWAAMVDNANMPAVFDATANVGNAVAQYRDDYQHILIDCPPQLQSEQTQAALASADVVVIPVLPSPLDLWATVAVNEGIASARESNPDLKALLVINQMEPSTKLSKLIRDVIQELGIPAATTTLNRRVVYRASVLQGKSVSQMGRTGAFAADEMRNLLAEILAI